MASTVLLSTHRLSGRGLGLLGAATAALTLAACAPGGKQSAVRVSAVATTGPLYSAATNPTHGCTASVLASSPGDLVITAAHCISGTGRGMSFVPGSVQGSAPYGRWTVTAAYVDPGWRYYRDPKRDVAILRVAAQDIGGVTRHVQQLTGGNQLTPTTAANAIGLVFVPAYTAGVAGSPIGCFAFGYDFDGYPAFDCDGYVGGTSGAPFIHGRSVVGVIGGLHQGGCYPYTSYSAPFDATTVNTYERAVAGSAPDVLPPAGPDGC